MEVIYKLNIEELDANLLQSLQLAFKGKQVEITVRKINETETQYLLSSQANRAHLEKAMEDLAAGRGITFNTQDFLKEYRNKISQSRNKDITVYEDKNYI